MTKSWPDYSRAESRSGRGADGGRFKVSLTSKLPCDHVIVARGHHGDTATAERMALVKLRQNAQAHRCADTP